MLLAWADALKSWMGHRVRRPGAGTGRSFAADEARAYGFASRARRSILVLFAASSCGGAVRDLPDAATKRGLGGARRRRRRGGPHERDKRPRLGEPGGRRRGRECRCGADGWRRERSRSGGPFAGPGRSGRVEAVVLAKLRDDPSNAAGHPSGIPPRLRRARGLVRGRKHPRSRGGRWTAGASARRPDWRVGLSGRSVDGSLRLASPSGLSLDGTLLASGSLQNVVVLSTADGSELRRVAQPIECAGGALQFSAEGDYLFETTGQTMCFWRMADGALVAEMPLAVQPPPGPPVPPARPSPSWP